MNLFLTGQATSNVFNGTVQLDSGGEATVGANSNRACLHGVVACGGVSGLLFLAAHLERTATSE